MIEEIVLQVLMDIIPGYRIRPASEMDASETNEQKLKKETKKLFEYEEALLRHYKHALQLLEAVALNSWWEYIILLWLPCLTDRFIFDMSV